MVQNSPLPAVAYVRMSTEHQQYSTENQLDRIREFATRRNLEIMRIFADEGKNGLGVKGRDSLRAMIAEVEAGVRFSRMKNTSATTSTTARRLN